jgi:hypothetical protein
MSDKSDKSDKPPYGKLVGFGCEPRGLTALYGRAGWGELGHVSITVPNVRRSSIIVASISMVQRMPQRHDLPRCATLATMLVII